MSFTDKKREEIKKYILRKIAVDDKDFVNKTMDNFGISITSVKRYISEARNEGVIEVLSTTACGYQLTEKKFCQVVSLTDGQVEESQRRRCGCRVV